jgi:hypothetical protein
MDMEDTTDTFSERGKDLRETVDAARGGLERLIGKIPGYKGYKDKEMRREADKLLRDRVALELSDQRKRLSELQNRLLSQAMIEYLDDVERALTKLTLLHDRIRTATYGYAGLFDAVKVKEEQLDELYEYDAGMLSFADELASDIDRLASAITAREGVPEAIGEVLETVDAANRTFDHRHEAILQAETYE